MNRHLTDRERQALAVIMHIVRRFHIESFSLKMNEEILSDGATCSYEMTTRMRNHSCKDVHKEMLAAMTEPDQLSWQIDEAQN